MNGFRFGLLNRRFDTTGDETAAIAGIRMSEILNIIFYCEKLLKPKSST